MNSETGNIAIGLGTYKRPEMLRQALASLEGLILPADLQVSLIICDNNPDDSAKVIIEEFGERFSFQVHYLRESKPGTVFYFNRILEKAEELNVGYLAIFDDDETVDKSWLASLYGCMITHKAAAIQGIQIMDVPEREDREILQRHTSQKSQKDGKILTTAYGYNVMIDMKFVRENKLRYNPLLNLTGGCDKLFFLEMARLGGKIVLCNEAITYEKLPTSRASVDWLYERSYRIGHNNFTINRILSNRLVALTKALGSVFSNTLSIIIKPLSERNHREIVVSRKKRSAEIKGTFDAIIGRKYEEYKVIHGS